MDFSTYLIIAVMVGILLSFVAGILNIYVTSQRVKRFKKQSEMLGIQIKKIDAQIEEAKKKLQESLNGSTKN